MKFLKHLFTIRDPWIRGWIFAWCTLGLTQAWRGKEETLRVLSENWVDPTYSVPFCLGAIALCVWSSFQKKDDSVRPE
jgi:hypothetical protein